MDIPITRTVPVSREFSQKRGTVRPIKGADAHSKRRKKNRDPWETADDGVVVRLSSRRNGEFTETEGAKA